MSMENVRIEKVNDQTLLINLVSLYLHDLSEFADDLKINSEGKFEYEGIQFYFKDKELLPFFIYLENEIAGFILFNTGKYVPDAEYSIHEIFVLKSFRGKGIATSAVKNIFEMYKGEYRVEQLKDNKLAVEFWKNFYKHENINYVEKEEIIDGFKVYTQFFHA